MKLEHHIFVCRNERAEGNPKGSCTLRGSESVFMRFRQLLKEKGLAGKLKSYEVRLFGTL